MVSFHDELAIEKLPLPTRPWMGGGKRHKCRFKGIYEGKYASQTPAFHEKENTGYVFTNIVPAAHPPPSATHQVIRLIDSLLIHTLWYLARITGSHRNNPEANVHNVSTRFLEKYDVIRNFSSHLGKCQ